MVLDSLPIANPVRRTLWTYRPSPFLVLLAVFNLVVLFRPSDHRSPVLKPQDLSRWSTLSSYISASKESAVLNLPWSSRSAAPPATCDYCLLNPDDRMCEYGRDNIRLSRAFDGSGARVRRMLEKALDRKSVV